MPRVTGLGYGLLFLMWWMVGCRSERAAFESPLITANTNTRQLSISPDKPGYQRNDSVVTMALTPAIIKKIGFAKVAVPAGKNRRSRPPQRQQPPHILFIDKSLQHQSATAAPGGNAGSGWKGFGEFMLLMSLPLALFGALVGGIFNVSFWAGLAYVVLGFAALFVLALLAVVGYQLYKKVATLRSK